MTNTVDVFSCPNWLERATARVEHLLLNPEIRYGGEPVIQVRCGPAVLVQHNEHGQYILSYDYEDGYKEYVRVNSTTEVAKELYKVGM